MSTPSTYMGKRSSDGAGLTTDEADARYAKLTAVVLKSTPQSFVDLTVSRNFISSNVWTDFTPQFKGATTDPNMTLLFASYNVLGSTIYVRIKIRFSGTSIGSGAYSLAALPATTASMASMVIGSWNFDTLYAGIIISTGTTTATLNYINNGSQVQSVTGSAPSALAGGTTSTYYINLCYPNL